MEFSTETRILIRVLPHIYVEIIKFYIVNNHTPRWLNILVVDLWYTMVERRWFQSFTGFFLFLCVCSSKVATFNFQERNIALPLAFIIYGLAQEPLSFYPVQPGVGRGKAYFPIFYPLTRNAERQLVRPFRGKDALRYYDCSWTVSVSFT